MAEDDKYFLRKKANRLEEENAKLKAECDALKAELDQTKKNLDMSRADYDEMLEWYVDLNEGFDKIRRLFCNVEIAGCDSVKKCPECIVEKIFCNNEGIGALKTEIERLKTRQLPDGVEWPTDADGQRIEVGDHLKSATGIDRKATVVGFAFKPLYKFDGDEYEFMLHECGCWRHYEPDPFEKLIRDIAKHLDFGDEDLYLQDDCAKIVGITCDECASTTCDKCREKMAAYYVERVKALAGVE